MNTFTLLSFPIFRFSATPINRLVHSSWLQVSSEAEGRYACMQEAMERGLGEGNLDKIEVLGESIESTKERFRDL